MASPRKCPDCETGVIKNAKALRCWDCYNTKIRQIVGYDVSQHTGKGEKHPRWKGGKWLYWRRQALIRDNYTCKHCGLYDKEIMDVDHIVPIRATLKERREMEKQKDIDINGINNLQTLCPNCHKRKTIREAKYCSSKTPLIR